MSTFCGQLIGWSPSVDEDPYGGSYTRTAQEPSQAFLNSPSSASSSSSNPDSGLFRSSCPSTRRQHEPGWVARPRNAFIVFRCDYSQIHRRKGRRIRRPPGILSTEPSLSKRAAMAWKQMTPEEKEPYIIRAEQERDDHMRNNPDYRFRPQRHPGTGPKSRYKLRSSLKPVTDGKVCPPTNCGSSCELPTVSTASTTPTSWPSSSASGSQSGIHSDGQHLSTSSTRWIQPIACDISATPLDGAEIPAEMMPTEYTAYNLTRTPSCTTTETTCSASTQPHLFQDGEISTSPIATGTQISSNTLASPPEVTDFFSPSNFTHCGGYYGVQQYGTLPYPGYASEGLWYNPAAGSGSHVEPMAPCHTNSYGYAVATDYQNSLQLFEG